MRRPWAAVLSAGIGVSMSISPAFLTVSGLYLVPVTHELGWTRTDFALGISLVSLLAVVATPFAGFLIDRLGAKPLALAAAIALPLCLLGESLLGPSHAQFLALAAFTGAAAAIASPLVFVSVVPQWIEHKLGLAIAVAMTGLGLGQVFWSLVSPRLIDAFGWRRSWQISAVVLVAVALPNALLLFREHPKFASARRNPTAVALDGESFGEALRSRTFCLAGLSIMLVSMVGAGLALHIVPLLTDAGIPRSRSALALSALAAGSLGGRLVAGFLLDRVRCGIVGAVLFAGQSAGLLLLLHGSTAGGAPVYCATFLVGLALGAEADLMPFLIRRRFGMRAYGKLFGVMFALYQIGPVIGPWLLSRTYDRLGSYTPMIVVFAGASALGAVLIALTDAQHRVSAAALPSRSAPLNVH